MSLNGRHDVNVFPVDQSIEFDVRVPTRYYQHDECADGPHGCLYK